MGSGLLFARTTGLKVWDGAKVLAQLLLLEDPSTLVTSHPHLSNQPFSLAGKLVVELGAGLGLVSVVASTLGAEVVATDGDADLVRLLKKNLAHNRGLHVVPYRTHQSTSLDSKAQASTPAQLDSLAAAGSHVRQAVSPVPPARAAALLWGDAAALQAAGLHDVRLISSNDAGSSNNAGSRGSGHISRPVDMVLMADVVYGSNPGVWERLVDTLSALAAPSTVILQAESRRIEGVLYGEYWSIIEAAGFQVHELQLPQLLGQQWEELQAQNPAVNAAARHQGARAAAEALAGAELRAEDDVGEAGAQLPVPVRAWVMFKTSDRRED